MSLAQPFSRIEINSVSRDDRQHVSDRATPPPVAVDLFAGGGGFSLGLRRAGFEIALANEYSVDPEWTYRSNILDDDWFKWPVPISGATGLTLRQHRLDVREVIEKHRHSVADDLLGVMRGGDIATVLRTEWLQGWKASTHYRDVDVLVAGPPCQGFSSAGAQNVSDERNQLVFEALRVIAVLCPRLVVIENVPGMLLRHSFLLRQVGERLADMTPGYNVAIELLHADELGVPQTRKRLALIGVRRDLMEESGHGGIRDRVFPVTCPDSSPSATAPHRRHRPIPHGSVLTSREIMGDLSRTPPIYDRSPTPEKYFSRNCPTAFQREMRTPRELYLNGGLATRTYVNEYRNHEASVHNETVRDRMQKMRESAAASREGRAQRCSSQWLKRQFIDQHPNLNTQKLAQRVLLPDHWPALTVTSLPDDIVHFRENRIPTVREMARLQTFPDWFEFRGVRTTGFERRRAGIYVPQYTQVANAVPPRLAHAIAARLRRFFAMLSEDRTCSWREGVGVDALYDRNVNRPGSAVRKLLDELNAHYISYGSKRKR